MTNILQQRYATVDCGDYGIDVAPEIIAKFSGKSWDELTEGRIHEWVDMNRNIFVQIARVKIEQNKDIYSTTYGQPPRIFCKDFVRLELTDLTGVTQSQFTMPRDW